MNNGEILKNLRINRNKTQKEIAQIIGINRVQYNQYEINYNNIPIKHLNSLANYYCVSIDYLLGLSMESNCNVSRLELNTKVIANRLKEFRNNNKLTQENLAYILNTNQSVIANYERGRTVIATPFLYTICKKYHVSADYLLGKVEDERILIP